MGYFDPGTDFIVKMMKCHRYVHTTVREVYGGCMSQICAALDLSGTCLTPPRREKRPDILNGLGFKRFAGDYD